MKQHLSLIAWLALAVIWGSNFIFMKWGTESISALQVVLIRVVVGSLPVAVYAVWRKQLRLSQLRHLHHFAVMACLAAAVYYYGFAKGTSLLPSGIAGAVSGAIPLFATLAAVVFLPEEKLTLPKAGGLLLGLIGVVMIARPFDAEPGSASTAGVLYIVAGSLSLGLSFVYAKKFISPLGIPAAALVTWQLGLASLLLAVVTDFNGLARITADPVALWGTVFGLGVLGTGLAFIIYYFIVQTMGAVRASSVTYLPPVVALLIGVLFVGETVTVLDYLATGLILGGVVLLNRQTAPVPVPGPGQQTGQQEH